MFHNSNQNHPIRALILNQIPKNKNYPPRFHQSQLWDGSTPLSSSGSYDATKTGPLCHQGRVDPGPIEEFKEKRVVDLVMEVGGPLLALAVGVIINLINSILELDPSVLGPVTGTKKVRRKPTQSD